MEAATKGVNRAHFGFLVPQDERSLSTITIREGSNAVGRGDLQEKIMQISRNHLEINAASHNEQAELVVTGVNPVVLVSGGTRNKLAPGSKSRLAFGDVLELLPGKFPFKLVRSCCGTDATQRDASSSTRVTVATGSITIVETDNKRKRQIDDDEAFARALQEMESLPSPKHLRGQKDGTSPQLQNDPCSFRLLHVQGLPEAANSGCVRISDVIQGDVLVAILSNYMVDFNWLLSACPILTTVPKVVVLHGESNTPELQLSKPGNFVLFKPPLRISYGTHHSKAMFLVYPTGVRIVVHTANYISVDWNNKTQGLWMQDFPFKSMTGNMEASIFENDLVDYLTALEWMGCTVNIPGQGDLKINPAYFRNFDYSNAAVRLVASVPGYHSGRHLNKWGHLKLRSIFEEEKFEEHFQGSPLVYQFSSLGSLDEKWMDEFAASTCEGTTCSNRRLGPGNIQIVFPTVEDVKCSIEGYRAGGAIPSPLKNVEKPFLKKYWSRWRAEHSGRSQAMPHFKSYVRYQNDSLAWFCLTSANLSKAAWGALQKKNTQLMIRSYELGVVLVPSLLKQFKNNRFSCTERPAFQSIIQDMSQEQNVQLCTMQANDSFTNKKAVKLPIPYALPPPKYTAADEPWSWDRRYLEPDAFGFVWPRTRH